MTSQDEDAPSAFDHKMGDAALAGDSGEFDAAASAFAEAQALEPDRIEPAIGLALIALRRGDYGAAVENFTSLTERDDCPPSAFVGLALAHQNAQSPRDAIAAYRAAADRWPDDPDRWADLAGALAEQGALMTGLAAAEKALALNPGCGPAVANAVRIHLSHNAVDPALTIARTAVEAAPDDPENWKALGGALLEGGDPSACLEAFERALSLDASDVETVIGRGYAFERLGAFDQAAADYAAACAAPAPPALAWFRRGALAMRMERVDEARSSLARARRLDPDDVYGASLLLAQLGGPTPARVPPAYARTAFDAMAAKFDDHLGALGYDAPKRLVEACDALGLLASPGPDVMDLGCGTGLIGAALAGRARRLTGVDLSPRMIERAGARGGYDSLIVGDAVAALADGAFDLALAADFLIYIGDLDPVFASAAKGLTASGRFAATIELDDADVAVRPSGRFAHSEGHVRAMADAHGFSIETEARFALRQEEEATIAGWLFVACK